MGRRGKAGNHNFAVKERGATRSGQRPPTTHNGQISGLWVKTWIDEAERRTCSLFKLTRTAE
jgi:hypothetical protein